jgi:hypothetical protein
MSGDLKLTSVKVEPKIYETFRIGCITSGFTLQKLLNRSLDLYNSNKEYQKLIDNHIIDQMNGKL